jgi:hypothetical protein
MCATIYHTFGDPSYFKEGFNRLQNLNSSLKESQTCFLSIFYLKDILEIFLLKFTICYE